VPLDHVEISIRSLEFRRKEANLDRPVMATVFDGDRLLPRYKAYKVVDKRISNRR